MISRDCRLILYRFSIGSPTAVKPAQVPVVRGGQAPPVPQLGEAQRRGAAAAAGVQVVPGHQQPGRHLGHRRRGVRGGGPDHPGENLREGAPCPPPGSPFFVLRSHPALACIFTAILVLRCIFSSTHSCQYRFLPLSGCAEHDRTAGLLLTLSRRNQPLSKTVSGPFF